MSELDAKSIPEIKNKVPPLAGLLKNAQGRALAGVALVMVLVIVFSGRNAPKEPAKALSPAAVALDPSQARIQEYKARLEEQTRELAAEEAQLAQTKEALGVREPAPRLAPTGALASSPASERLEPEKNWIELDREKRDYQGLYASNLALSYRAALESAAPSQISPTAPAPTAAPTAGAPAKASKESGPRAAKEYPLYEGTILETVLTNRLDGSFSGPVNALVTTNVYAPDHQTLLVPQGSRVLGEVKKVDSLGQQRLAVVFHRLLMPNGYSVSLDQFHALSQVGETGLRDQVNHHYLQIFGVSLAIGAIAGLSQANTQVGLSESAADAYRQGMGASLSQSSLHILDRYLNVLPTFTIREGQRIKVYLAQDLKLPAYDSHPAAE